MRRSHLFGGIVTLAMLCLPLAISPWKSDDSLAAVAKSENRSPVDFPSLTSLGALLDADTWTQVDGAIRDRMPLRPDLVRIKRAWELAFLGQWKLGEVGVGRDDWLFYLPSLDYRGTPTDQVQTVLDAVDAFAVEHEYPARLILTVGPDKSTVYPEYLSPPLRDLADRAREQRDLVHAWFATPGEPERIAPWDLYLDAKDTATQFLFEPTGSHYSSYGSMILAEAMIDAVDPTLWDPDEVTYMGTLRYQVGLATLAGLTGWARDFDQFEVVRPGVELVTFMVAGEEPVDGDGPPEGESARRAPARYLSRSSGQPLIGGRTLIIHDSYIAGYLRPTLRQFFADVTFVAFEDIPRPADFLEALSDFDLVLMESAEREFPRNAATLFVPTTPNGQHLLRDITRRVVGVFDAGFESGDIARSPHVFDGAGGAWSITPAVHRDGSYSAQYDSTGQTGAATLTTNGKARTAGFHRPAPPGTEFTYTAHVRAGDGAGNALRALIAFYDAAGVLVETVPGTRVRPTTEWEQISVTATAPPTSAYAVFRIQVLNNGNTGTYYIDDISPAQPPD